MGHADVVRLLVAAGTPLNVRNGMQKTALDQCHSRHPAIADFLIKHGATPGAMQDDSAAPAAPDALPAVDPLADLAADAEAADVDDKDIEFDVN